MVSPPAPKQPALGTVPSPKPAGPSTSGKAMPPPPAPPIGVKREVPTPSATDRVLKKSVAMPPKAPKGAPAMPASPTPSQLPHPKQRSEVPTPTLNSGNEPHQPKSAPQPSPPVAKHIAMAPEPGPPADEAHQPTHEHSHEALETNSQATTVPGHIDTQIDSPASQATVYYDPVPEEPNTVPKKQEKEESSGVKDDPSTSVQPVAPYPKSPAKIPSTGLTGVKHEPTTATQRAQATPPATLASQPSKKTTFTPLPHPSTPPTSRPPLPDVTPPKVPPPAPVAHSQQPAPTSTPGIAIAPEAQPLVHNNYKERQASYACFKRQISGEVPPPDGQTVPEELAQAWEEAVASRSRTKKNALFAKWCESGANWGMSLVCRYTIKKIVLTQINTTVNTVCTLRIHISHTRTRSEKEKGKKKMGH